MSLLQKALPGIMTWQAKFRRPISDCNWRNVTVFEYIKDVKIRRISSSFSTGSLSSIFIVSNSIPKNVKTSTGSTVLSSARGTPHNLQVSLKKYQEFVDKPMFLPRHRKGSRPNSADYFHSHYGLQ